MDRSQLFDRRGGRALLAYLAVWGAAVAYLAVRGADWIFPIASLVIFGLIFSAASWFLTRKMAAPAVPVARPQWESLALIGYIVVYAVLFIGIGLGSVRNALPPGPTQELAVVVYKLAI